MVNSFKLSAVSRRRKGRLGRPPRPYAYAVDLALMLCYDFRGMPAKTFKILLVRLSAFGDIIQALPALTALRRRHPQARIHWLVARKCAELLAGHPDLDRLHVFDATFKGFLAMRRELRREGFTAALDFQGLIKSGLLTWLSGAPRRLGKPPRDCREWPAGLFYNQWVSPAAPHLVRQYYEMAAPLGVDDFQPLYRLTLPEVPLPPVFRERPVALHVGGGWETKRYAPEKWGELARRLIEELGRPVVIFWGPGDEARAETAQRIAPQAQLAPPGSYREMGYLLTHCALLAACESGPMHLAVAVGTPTVCLVSVTDPRRSGPFDERSKVVLPPPPHHWTTRRTGESPADRIPVDEVLLAVRELL